MLGTNRSAIVPLIARQSWSRTMTETAIAWLRFVGCFVAGVGILLMGLGALSDVSTPGLEADSERVVNLGLMFAALTKEIVGGFLLVSGALIFGFGLLVPKGMRRNEMEADAITT